MTMGGIFSSNRKRLEESDDELEMSQIEVQEDEIEDYDETFELQSSHRRKSYTRYTFTLAPLVDFSPDGRQFVDIPLQELSFLKSCQLGSVDDVKKKLDEDVTPEAVLVALLLVTSKNTSFVARELIGHCGTLNSVDYHWSPLHVAVATNNKPIVELLLENGATANQKSSTKTGMLTPLHLAAHFGQIDMIELLITEGNASIAETDDNGNTVLHHAARNRHHDVLKLLLQKSNRKLLRKSVANQDKFTNLRNLAGDSALQLAVKSCCHKCVRTLIEDGDADVNQMDDKGCTALCRMIRTMPQITKSVLDKRMRLHRDDIVMDFSLLDDTLYTSKEQHALMVAAESKHQEILDHPYLKAYFWETWHKIYIYYLLFLLLFMLPLLLSMSMYMANVKHPHSISEPLCPQLSTHGRYNLNMSKAMKKLNKTGLMSHVVAVHGDTWEWGYQHETYEELVCKWISTCFALVGICMEIAQLRLVGWKGYFNELHNYMDWFTYISVILSITLSFTSCGERTMWQWHLGTICVFMASMNALFYLRRLATYGIYVVMIGIILKTFLEFFLVFFLFIAAFSFTFYLLLQNQPAFRTFWYSTIKTTVMMVGEITYEDIFHSNYDDENSEAQLNYEAATYIVFVCFLVLMSLILMNLLTGLAVSDVSTLLQDSKRKMLSMQIAFALDVEFSFPLYLRQQIIQEARAIISPTDDEDTHEDITSKLDGIIEMVNDNVVHMDKLDKEVKERASKVEEMFKETSAKLDVLVKRLNSSPGEDSTEEKMNDS